jgi:hypothetical protein
VPGYVWLTYNDEYTVAEIPWPHPRPPTLAEAILAVSIQDTKVR